jgi:hypothetical protein
MLFFADDSTDRHAGIFAVILGGLCADKTEVVLSAFALFELLFNFQHALAEEQSDVFANLLLFLFHFQ